MSSARNAIAIALGLGALVCLNIFAISEVIDVAPVEVAAAETPDAPSDTRPQKRVEITALTQTLDRPLFRPDRRPVPSNPAAALEESQVQTVAAGPVGKVTLVGTLHYGSRKQRALLRLPDRAAAAWVEIGERVGDWTLREVSADAVVLEARGVSQKVPMYPLSRSNAQQ